MANGLSSILPLLILFILVAGLAFVGYGIYNWSQELGERAGKKMEKKHMSFTKDGGLRVGVKEMKNEDYADKTQRALVNTWNASYTDSSNGKRPAAPSHKSSSASGLSAPQGSSKHRSSSPVPGSFS